MVGRGFGSCDLVRLPLCVPDFELSCWLSSLLQLGRGVCDICVREDDDLLLSRILMLHASASLALRHGTLLTPILNNIDREEEGYRSKTLDDVITKDVLDQGVNGFEDNKSSVNCFDGWGVGV